MPYKNPTKQKQAQHNHYLANKTKYKEASRLSAPKFRANRSLWIQGIKAKLSCKLCGEERMPCLEFHHRNPKEKELTISRATWAWSKEKILKEIEKCDVLCSNCHACLHWDEKYN